MLSGNNQPQHQIYFNNSYTHSRGNNLKYKWAVHWSFLSSIEHYNKRSWNIFFSEIWSTVPLNFGTPIYSLIFNGKCSNSQKKQMCSMVFSCCSSFSYCHLPFLWLIFTSNCCSCLLMIIATITPMTSIVSAHSKY